MAKNSELFPWGDDPEEQTNSTAEPQQTQRLMDHPKPPAWQSQGRSQGPGLEGHGLHWMLPRSFSQAGKVLAHCQSAIQKLRLATGGTELAVYKIGITHEFRARFELYQKNGWTKMLIMHQTNELGEVEMLEAALILHERVNKQCRNVLKGGEGMRDKDFHPKFDPPYYCYCVSARADQGRWIT